jgi:phage terminase large subunit-like protein
MEKDVNFTKKRAEKRHALYLLKKLWTKDAATICDGIDERLGDYFRGILYHSEGTSSRHNVYEVLAAVKFLRMLSSYTFDAHRVKMLLRLREGEWRKDGKIWKHVRGGLKMDGNNGAVVYRWEPFQVFVIASVFGFKAWVDTKNEAGTRELLPTEKEKDGHIYDLRRVCTDFTFYGARKNDKTGLSAFMQLVFFLFEDTNSEVYCISNTAEQAKTLYNRTREMLLQIDPTHQRFRNTATVCDWLPTYHGLRTSFIKPLTAGPRSKDGLKAQLASIDEYGSAPYTKGKSDMQHLVDVVQSSMGSRREPLSFTTTTAGRIDNGPFVDKLTGLHLLLERELHYGETDARGNVIRPSLNADRTMCLLLEPDAWERDEEYLMTHENVRYEVCPMLGKVVQHSYYDDIISNVRAGLFSLDELVTKNFNIYKTSTTKEWITPELVRKLQIPQRITDCVGNGDIATGWIIFSGLDFSLGNDLHALSYLSTRISPTAGNREFFADCDAWITEESLNSAALRPVFEKWIADGWLRVSPGRTLQPELPIGRIAEVAELTDYNFLMFLYDPYKADIPINALKQYVVSLGVDPANVVVPCRQNYATFNPLVGEMDFLVKNDPPFIHFSESPLWPWEAGNMILDTSTDGMDNKKPRKKNDACKIDNWIALLMALKGYDTIDGNVGKQ